MTKGSNAVLDFWATAGPQKWFRKDASFDASIASEFGSVYRQACEGELSDWAETPEGALALIIVLDQFSRNLQRNSPLAFAQDSKALSVAKSALDAGWLDQVPKELAMFMVMPLMHSENLADQNRCVEIFEQLGGSTEHAVEHRDIVQQFGRFPHRNAVLGRNMSEAEKRYLTEGGFSG